MVCINLLRLDDAARRRLAAMEDNRQMPVCPGCGQRMRICMEYDPRNTGMYD